MCLSLSLRNHGVRVTKEEMFVELEVIINRIKEMQKKLSESNLKFTEDYDTRTYTFEKGHVCKFIKDISPNE